MEKSIKVNDVWLPDPDEDISVTAKKIKTEKQTEAGTTQVIVTRKTKLTVSGSWTLTKHWISTFRGWRDADTVTVACYYPNTDTLSEYTCQFEISSETHIKGARAQIPETGGIYQVNVTMTEL